jgi:iron-sulfur cluster repair protein YtfE (RIC family)
MTTDELVNLVADLAQEVDKEDPIDFGMLQVDEESVWHLMSVNVVDKYLDMSGDQIVMLATITKLLVDNFILNYKLIGNNKR